MRSALSRSRRLAVVWLILAVVVSPAVAKDLLAEFEAKTSVHVLENGWTFIIVERPVAPVFTFATVVDVGAAQEVPGITGLAHMFEHMAFKGTPTIGTRDYEAEKKALEEVEVAYIAYELARRDPLAESSEVERLRAVFEQRQKAAGEYAITNEMPEIVERYGGVGLNAFTNADITGYTYSFPAHRVELFALLESERFLNPVFREFYQERDVVQEERRLRTDSQPIGRLLEQVLATAFVAHPYKQPVVGYMSDLRSFTATDAREFHRRYYAPSNMVTCLVGHVTAEEVLPILEKYFGRHPAWDKPPALATVEPPQIGEKQVTLVDASQPVYLEMYHQPSLTHPDQAIYSAINDVLAHGRTSRLYRKLVRDQRIALAAGSFSGLPGAKYPTLWGAYAFPARGHSNEEVQASIREEIDRIQREPVSDVELERFRNRAKANVLRGVRSNRGLALGLAAYQTYFGDWREAFRQLDRIDEVTPEDILRVAQATFQPSNRTVGMIVTEEPAAKKRTPEEVSR